MRLVRFSVENYRSITKTENIPTSDFTVLIGQNNEGKSNILAALVTAMKIIRFHAQEESEGSDDSDYSKSYIWRRDFPVQFQKSESNKQTLFRVEFFLDDSEILSFKSEIGVSLNGHLPISVTIGKDNEPIFKVVKSGKNTKSLVKKKRENCQFYWPANCNKLYPHYSY